MITYLTIFKKNLYQHFELIFWCTAIVLLFFLNETRNDTSLCPFSALGFGRCMGCGIGHAIHYALKFEFRTSFQHHPMGILAVFVIFNRVKQLIIKNKHK